MDSYRTTGNRLGRPLLFALGRGSGVYRTIVASDPHVHRAARGSGPNAAGQIPHLHVPGIVALVLRSGLPGHEAGGELAQPGKVLPPVRRSHRRSSARRDRVVCVVALAEPFAGGRVGGHSAGVTHCEPTICQLPARRQTTSMYRQRIGSRLPPASTSSPSTPSTMAISPNSRIL